MLDIKLIRDNPELVKRGVAAKGADPVLVDQVLGIDADRRRLQVELDEIKAEKNKVSKEIAKLSPQERQAKIAELKGADKAGALQTDLKEAERALKDLLYQIPNLADEDVEVGPGESANKVTKTVGRPTEFAFGALDYMKLCEPMDLVDTERAAKVSGSRFGYIKGAAAMLEFALIQYTYNSLINPKVVAEIAGSVSPYLSQKTFIPIVPPVMIREEAYLKAARMDADARDERYHLANDDLYLVGSAEHSLVPMHMDETLQEKELPLRYLGFSTAFRRESGTYGKDTKGILRVHQFDKIEMEVFATPEQSRDEHEFLIACAEYLVKGLGLPYQVVSKGTGDVGNPNARGVDIEIWMPGENKYRETHSIDYMSDYQARRLNTRFKSLDGLLQFVHTHDATAFAIGRSLIAIMENYQQEDGSIAVPEVLRPYMPVSVIKGPFGMGE